MNQKERLISVLQGDQVDRVPFICPGGMMNMVLKEVWLQSGFDWEEGHLNPSAMTKLAKMAQANTQIENFGVPFCMTAEAADLGAMVDLKRPGVEPRIIGYQLSQLTEWRNLPDYQTDQGRTGTVVQAIRQLNTASANMPIVASITGPISLCTSLLEPMQFYRAMGWEAALVNQMLEKITDFLISYSLDLISAGADVLVIADPSASGEILGPKQFEAFALLSINRILDAVSNRVATMVHICGRLKRITTQLNDLHTTTISIDSSTSINHLLNTIQDKQIAGNVSTHLLLNGDDEQVARSAAHCLSQGVSILAPACGLSPDTPASHLRTMARIAMTADKSTKETN